MLNKTRLFIMTTLIMLSVMFSLTLHAQAYDPSEYTELVFEETFTGPALDTDKWVSQIGTTPIQDPVKGIKLGTTAPPSNNIRTKTFTIRPNKSAIYVEYEMMVSNDTNHWSGFLFRWNGACNANNGFPGTGYLSSSRDATGTATWVHIGKREGFDVAIVDTIPQGSQGDFFPNSSYVYKLKIIDDGNYLFQSVQRQDETPITKSGTGHTMYLTEGDKYIGFYGRDSASPTYFRNLKVYTVPSYTLNVTSNATAAITVSETDKDSLPTGGVGNTPLTLHYALRKTTNLTAPATVGSQTFVKWQKDGVDYSTDYQISVGSVTANATYNAVYSSSDITLSGIVNLSDIVGQNPNYNYKATLKIYKSGNTNCDLPDVVKTVDLDANGNYSFTVAPQGAGCTVVVKAGTETNMDPSVRYHFLAKKLTNVDLSANATLTTVNLVNGDINDDNLIDAFDFTILMQAYDIAEDASSGESDLNNDGNVDAFDFTILMLSYDSAGDSCN